MIHRMPDPDPGRCPNCKPQDDAYGYPSMVRCLEYEFPAHICTFPDPPERLTTADQSLRSAVPKPWVKPDDPKPGLKAAYEQAKAEGGDRVARADLIFKNPDEPCGRGDQHAAHGACGGTGDPGVG